MTMGLPLREEDADEYQFEMVTNVKREQQKGGGG